MGRGKTRYGWHTSAGGFGFTRMGVAGVSSHLGFPDAMYASQTGRGASFPFPGMLRQQRRGTA